MQKRSKFRLVGLGKFGLKIDMNNYQHSNQHVTYVIETPLKVKKN